MKPTAIALTISLPLASFCGSNPGFTQVVADEILSTRVGSSDNLNFVIENGDRAGNNLFHSFREFSVPTGGSATFNHAIDIQNIFSRVTGGSPSRIDGLIRANGSANLFLLNPSGILFGPNARLNIGGSFLATTANSIDFADGTQFSAAAPTDAAILTVSTPIGLQFGSNPGRITHQAATGFQVQPGRSIAFVGGDLAIDGGRLSAPSGNIALGSVGGNSRVGINPTSLRLNYAAATGFQDIRLSQGARVDTSGIGGGAIEVQARQFSLSQGGQLRSNTLGAASGADITVRASDRIDIMGTEDLSAYSVYLGEGGEDFAELGLSGIFATVAADATGNGGSIQLTSPHLTISRIGAVAANTRGVGNSGNVSIRGQTVEIIGNPDGNGFPSLLSTSTVSAGRSGNVTVQADRFVAREFSLIQANSVGTGDGGDISFNVQRFQAFSGSQISAGTFGAGDSGDLTVNATESVELIGFNTWAEGVFSTGLFTSVESGSTGNGGTLSMTTGRLSLLQGGKIAANVVGNGNAGNIILRANDIAVADPVVDFSGALSGIIATVGKESRGQGGRLDILTDRLRIFNGGQITAAIEGIGSAGNINIQARAVDISGVATHRTAPNRIFQSSIVASSTTASSAGSINLVSDRLSISDRGNLTVSNTGTGNAGNLNIRTRDLSLTQGASLRAEVNGGSQGNIQLQVGNLLQLQRGSRIVTSATGRSTGGNIAIEAPVILGVENSDIIANAVQGSGGNIEITTQGIFGLTFRSQLTPENDITASSQFGINGTVQINNIVVNPVASLTALPSEVTDSSQQVAQTCANTQSNHFVVTGRGGVPANPTQTLESARIWNDLRVFVHQRTQTETLRSTLPHASSHSSTANSSTANSSTANATVLTEASNWQVNAQGDVELVAANNTVSSGFQPVACQS